MWKQIEALTPLPGAQPDFQACLEAFPALEHAKTTEQSVVHHAEGDVWTHTKMVVEELLALPAYQVLSRADQVKTFLAALLHDAAKYRTTVRDDATGDIKHPGHSRKGAIDARLALWDAGAPFDVREAVCRMISVHQVPMWAMGGSTREVAPEFIVRELSWQLDVRLLALLAEADIRGRVCQDSSAILDNIELFRELAREENCFGRPRDFVDAHTAVSYFRGASVHPDYPLFQEPGSHVIVMSGPPAAGKNTWVESNHPDLPVISLDDAREELGLRHGKNEGKVSHLAIDRAKDLLRAKAPFVWNATHMSEQTREKTLGLLYSYNAQVEVVYLERPRAELLARNNRRDTSLNNKTLQAMLTRWEPPLPTEAHVVRYLVD
jgi:predicted kinase